MKAWSEPRPMHRSATHALATVIRAQRQWMLAAGDAQIVPIQFVRAGLITDPVPLGIPKRTGLDADDTPSCLGQALHQHPPGGADAHDHHIHLIFVGIVVHRRVETLYRPQVMPLVITVDKAS